MKNINRVTLTGADNSIEPQQLFELSEKYPFVEWGILLSRNSMGSKRFPSLKWMNRLESLDKDYFNQEILYSGHLCGSFVKELLMGETFLYQTF